MKVIIGLGNPGERYENSRHNVGFNVLDSLLHKLEAVVDTFWDEEKKGKYLYKKVKFKDQDIMLVKPQTFMNRSGQAVVLVTEFHKVLLEDLTVIYDDLDLPLGKIRVRFGGAAGGHKGVESIIESLGDDKFLRVRLGIGHPHYDHSDEKREKKLKSKISVEDYVIAPFERDEESKAREMIKRAEKNVLTILEHGSYQYMSKYHKE